MIFGHCYLSVVLSFGAGVMWHCQLVLGETSSPASNPAKSKHVSSAPDHRKSSGSHATVPARSSPRACRSPSVGSVPDPGVGKAKNVCVVEPQSTASKATAVVAPLVAAESHQFTQLFGEPIVKSDASKKHHSHHRHQKVC